MHSAGAPSNLDFSRTRASEHGIYRAEIVPEGDSIPQGKLQKWTLHLDAANGAPPVPKTFRDLLGPVQEAVQRLGETEDETEEFLRQELEAHRQERRAKALHGAG